MIRDETRFRRHKGACPYYRENWVHGEERTAQGELLLYEIYCLKGWPAETEVEQAHCMLADRVCWRNGESHRVTPAKRTSRRESRTA